MSLFTPRQQRNNLTKFGGIWDKQDDPYNRTSWAAADRIAWYLAGKEIRYSYEMNMCVGYAAKKGWITQEQHELHLEEAEEIKGYTALSNVSYVATELKQKERVNA
jgi:hypothetical protein